MALTAGNTILSTDINNLKTRVRNEMSRRNAYDNISSGRTGGFSQSAASGQLARISHFNETVGYINVIKPTGIATDRLRALQGAWDQLSGHETWSINYKTWSSTDCTTGYCRGLCYTTCTSTCRGCSGSCSGSCTSCSGSCTGGCRSGCEDICSGGCTESHGYCSNYWSNGRWMNDHSCY